MTDIEEEPVHMHRLHVVAGAARPRHTLLGPMELTARWTLRTVFFGHTTVNGATHGETPTGKPVSIIDTLHYDN